MKTNRLLSLTFLVATASLAYGQEGPQLTIGQARALPIYDKILLQPNESSETQPTTAFDVADFNGDGRLDVVMIEAAGEPFHQEPPFVAAVYLQTQQNTFERQPNTHAVPIENRVAGGLFARDFNRDGHLDLLVNDRLVDLLLLRGKADGTFEEPKRVGIPYNLFTVDDLNKDSVPDVVAATEEGEVSVLLSTGGGEFVVSQVLDSVPSTPPGYAAPQSLIADVNRDGNPDVVVCSVQDFDSTFTGNLDVFPGKGDGTFHDVIRNERVATWRGELADFNNDGFLDYAGAKWSPRAVEIWMGRGDGHFTKGRTYTTPSGYEPQRVKAADLNQDGIMDLVISQVAREQAIPLIPLGITLGNGDGTFQAWKQHFAFPGYVCADVFVGILDLNGDGRLELLAPAHRYSNLADRGLAISIAQEPKPDPTSCIVTVKHSGGPVALETSSDLSTWVSIATNTPSSDWPVVHKANATGRAFYRAVTK